MPLRRLLLVPTFALSCATAAQAGNLLTYDFENAALNSTLVAPSAHRAGVAAGNFADSVGLGRIGVVSGADSQQYNANGIDAISANDDYLYFSAQFQWDASIESMTLDAAVNDGTPIDLAIEWATDSAFTTPNLLGTVSAPNWTPSLTAQTANTSPFTATAGTTYYFRIRAASFPTFGTSQLMLDNIRLNGQIDSPVAVPTLSSLGLWLLSGLMALGAFSSFRRRLHAVTEQ